MSGFGTFLGGDVGKINATVFDDMIFDSFSEIEVWDVGEEAAWKFLGEALFFVIWVADGHV